MTSASNGSKDEIAFAVRLFVSAYNFDDLPVNEPTVVLFENGIPEICDKSKAKMLVFF